MSKSMRIIVATAFVAAGIASSAGVAAAMPVADGLAIKHAVPSMVESVEWEGHHHGWGGAGAGFVAGAILGGALLGPRYYGPGPYYGPGYYAPQPYYAPRPYYAPEPYYADPGPYEADPTGGDPAGYCMQRFRSYDPRSGTYLGYDGYRHPCP